MNGLEPVSRVQVVDTVVSQIKDRIVNGTLLPGNRLPPEIELSDRLGVSRNTVREALRILEAQGWISRSRRGTEVLTGAGNLLRQSIVQVAQLSRVTVHELFEVRLMLEGELTALAAMRATSEEAATILALTHLESVAMSEAEFIDWNLSFHMAIASASHNRLLAALLDAVRDLTVSVQHAGALEAPVRHEAVYAHVRIAQAIADRNAEAARQAMNDHLREIEAALDPDYALNERIVVQ